MKKVISSFTETTINMKELNENDELVKSVRKLLLNQKRIPIEFKKDISFDNTTRLFSVKIPKSLALKSNLNKKSAISFVLNPNKETFEKIEKSNFIIYLEKK